MAVSTVYVEAFTAQELTDMVIKFGEDFNIVSSNSDSMEIILLLSSPYRDSCSTGDYHALSEHTYTVHACIHVHIYIH